MTFVLASGSGVRRMLLENAGLRVDVIPASIDEAAIKRAVRDEGGNAVDAASLLARLKAERISRSHPEALVIGADQILVAGEKWFDKPADIAAAGAHLRDLAGIWHELVTVVFCVRRGLPLWHHVARPRLRLRPLSEEAISAYLAAEGEMALTSVGAYRLEGSGIQLFDAIEGDYFSILGLPLLPLLGFLRQHLGREWIGGEENQSFLPYPP